MVVSVQHTRRAGLQGIHVNLKIVVRKCKVGASFFIFIVFRIDIVVIMLCFVVVVRNRIEERLTVHAHSISLCIMLKEILKFQTQRG